MSPVGSSIWKLGPYTMVLFAESYRKFRKNDLPGESKSLGQSLENL